jgi:hypothetical protein
MAVFLAEGRARPRQRFFSHQLMKRLRQIVSGSLDLPRFFTTLMGALPAAARSLAAVGIFGLVSYTAAQRTREFGIRVALGACPRRLLASTVRGTRWPPSVWCSDLVRAAAHPRVGGCIDVARSAEFCRVIWKKPGGGLCLVITTTDLTAFPRDRAVFELGNDPAELAKTLKLGD